MTATPETAWFTTRFDTTSESVTPANRMPLPSADHWASFTGANRLSLSCTRFPAITTWWAGGSSSESRVFGTIPAAL